MKRREMKRFLKNMIVAFCAGVFLCMPVTANAAEKEEILGKWTGGWANFTFYENGKASHDSNGDTKSYWMNSGSLTVTHNDGSTETVDYDFWRGWGYEMDDLADSDYADAVLYKIVEPGKMYAWNVVHWPNNGGKWEFGASKATMTKYTGSDDSDSSDAAGSSGGCDHLYEWSITTEPTETTDGVSSYQCIYCGSIIASQPVSADAAVRENLLNSIKNAEAGSTVTFDSEGWLCYPQYVLDALKERGDISLKTNFTYQGINYSFTIPAGSDYTNLEQADFYGFMYLFGAFNGMIVE